MKTVLAVIGGIVLVMFMLGLTGVGYFRLYYLPYPVHCERGHE